MHGDLGELNNWKLSWSKLIIWSVSIRNEAGGKGRVRETFTDLQRSLDFVPQQIRFPAGCCSSAPILRPCNLPGLFHSGFITISSSWSGCSFRGYYFVCFKQVLLAHDVSNSHTQDTAHVWSPGHKTRRRMSRSTVLSQLLSVPEFTIALQTQKSFQALHYRSSLQSLQQYWPNSPTSSPLGGYVSSCSQTPF